MSDSEQTSSFINVYVKKEDYETLVSAHREFRCDKDPEWSEGTVFGNPFFSYNGLHVMHDPSKDH